MYTIYKVFGLFTRSFKVFVVHIYYGVGDLGLRVGGGEVYKGVCCSKFKSIECFRVMLVDGLNVIMVYCFEIRECSINCVKFNN